MSLNNRSNAEAELQRGFALMQPVGLSLLDVNGTHKIEEFPQGAHKRLGYAERMARLEASLCKLAGEAPLLFEKRLFRETPLHVEAGDKDYELTLIAPDESRLSGVQHIQVPPAPWQALLREQLLTAFVPVAEPDGHGWFISAANNPFDRHVRQLVREEACAIYQQRREKLARLFPH